MDRAIYGKDARSSPTLYLENLLIQIGYAAAHDMLLCSMDEKVHSWKPTYHIQFI